MAGKKGVSLLKKKKGMENLYEIEHISQYNTAFGVGTFHPLVSVIDLSEATPEEVDSQTRIRLGFYSISLKESHCGNIRYGRNYYDYQEGTLVFSAPGQVLTVEPNLEVQTKYKGMTLLFHADILRGTTLGHNIKNYHFFSYEVFEALHLSESEKQTVLDCFSKIETELKRPIDKHSKTLIVANIELLLGYCVRFYDRQFITRSNSNKDILVKFENLLNEYFEMEDLSNAGLPTVKYCADKLHLSANYLGDLIKKETGKSPLEHIQFKVIDVAKEKIFDQSKTLSQIAYELGFKHTQHFSRLFKNETGYTPNEYRHLN